MADTLESRYMVFRAEFNRRRMKNAVYCLRSLPYAALRTLRHLCPGAETKCLTLFGCGDNINMKLGEDNNA